MRKSASLVLGAGLLVSGVASAQSTLTLYGIADMALVLERGTPKGSNVKLDSGVGYPSRWGLRGIEDLGGGYHAKFVMESWVNMSTGAMVGDLFGRQAYVGMDGPFGSVTMGRQYTPFMTANLVADPFGTTFAGASLNIVATQLRMSNAVKYATPLYNGFSGEFAYAFGGVPGSLSAQRQYGAAAGYDGGPLRVRLGFNSRNNNTATVHGQGDGNNTILAVSYDFGIFKIHGQYGIDKGLNSSPLFAPNPYNAAVPPTPSTNSRDYLLGFTVPIKLSNLLISFVHKDDRTHFDQDATQIAVGYVYPLSKRTVLYAAYAHIFNRNGAGYTVGNGSEPGGGNQALNLGMRVAF